MKPEIPSSEILRKYLANQCSDQDRVLVETWYDSLNKSSDISFSDDEEQKLLARIRTRISAKRAEAFTVFRPFRRIWAFASAAAAVLVIGLGYFFLNNKKHDVANSQPKAPMSETTKFCNHQRKVIRYNLPDKSVVWMQPEAEISYSKKFSVNKTREIQFKGEGFFDIQRDVNHPFIVHCGELTTKVLGTSFNIRANGDESTYKVSVVTGSVSVSSEAGENKSETVVLWPKQQAVFEKAAKAMVVKEIREEKKHLENWQSASLFFDEVPMNEVARRLENTFQIKIEFANHAIERCRLKIDLTNQRLPEILEMIETILGAKYELNDDKVTFAGDGCK